MKLHAKKAKVFLSDNERADWQDKALWVLRQKRDDAAQSVTEWEQLREQASKIKDIALSNLDSYLLQFEDNAIRNGAVVHWASDAAEFNHIILKLSLQNKVSKIVKSKSMLTEECGLNRHLERAGIEVVDTDLGERIIQFRNERPSHIVLPAIHLKKEDVSETFYEKLQTEKRNSDPQYLTTEARNHLRQEFLSADMAITGVNFAVAEKGIVVVCTNEGNADMGVHAAPIQVHCMGIEKIIPRWENLGVFTRLLARNATGQPITTYTSHYVKPRKNKQMHIVIVDNGRSKHLESDKYWSSLKCIRCGACLNTCPVYRRSGGHSYGSVIPGPIGSILAPIQKNSKTQYLPFASSLCGSCTELCPVKINIHGQLYEWRQEISKNNLSLQIKSFAMSVGGSLLAINSAYNFLGKVARFAIKNTPRKLIYNRLNPWCEARELPEVPKQSFKEWYIKNRKKKQDGKRNNHCTD